MAKRRREHGELAFNLQVELQESNLSIFSSNFILANYSVIKKHNQDLPVLIREADGTPARAFARFGTLFCCKRGQEG